jgi:hypothetical protein
MADKKISALTSLAQGDVAASTDVLPIVDTSATETKKITASALVGAGMTAGVTNVDINSGSIDGTTIGANSAAAGTFTNLTASGTVSFSGATVSNGGAVTTIDINGGTIDATSIGASSASTGAFTTLTTSSTVTLNGGTANGVLYLNGSKVATSGSGLVFDGTNLGVGVSPSYRLDILGAGATAALRINNATAGKSAMLVQSNGSTAGILGLTGFIKGDSSTNLGLFAETGFDIRFYTNGSPTERAVIDSSGNLGLGVTPSDWSSTTALQVGSVGGAVSSASTQISLSYNWVATATGNKYINNGFASIYQQNAGTHVWYNAPSGTAGNTITFTQAMTLDASGNLIVGGTSAPLSASNRGNITINGSSTAIMNLTIGGTNKGYIFHDDSAMEVWNADNSDMKFATNNTERARITAGGDLLVGTTSANGTLATSGRGYIEVNGTTDSAIGLESNGTLGGYLYNSATEFRVANYSNNPLTFQTNNTERARITSGGYFKASNTGTYNSSTSSQHEFYQTDNSNTLRLTSTSSAVSGAYGLYVDLTADPNATDSFFIRCYGGANQRASIRSNGGLANYQSNNVDLSDARTKKDIAPAASMWGKIGALEIVTYKYNDQTHDDVNLGVIAQQVESVEPVWVDADGFGETPEGEEPLKTVYTKDITFAAIKALQEAMTRIEQLEAKVAALESK